MVKTADPFWRAEWGSGLEGGVDGGVDGGGLATIPGLDYEVH
jgi:hypothetical protein